MIHELGGLDMNSGFWCRYCGKQKPWGERNYDVGLYLAEAASFAALGHTEGVSPYLICNQCANDVIKEDSTCDKT